MKRKAVLMVAAVVLVAAAAWAAKGITIDVGGLVIKGSGVKVVAKVSVINGEKVGFVIVSDEHGINRVGIYGDKEQLLRVRGLIDETIAEMEPVAAPAK